MTFTQKITALFVGSCLPMLALPYAPPISRPCLLIAWAALCVAMLSLRPSRKP